MSANFKCRLCAVCDGEACAGELPGMGGVFDGKNHILNCKGWKKIFPLIPQEKIEAAQAQFSVGRMRLAPITGAEENVGWPDEESFYAPFYEFAARCGLKLSVGDGCPDQKLQAGIAAVKALNQKASLTKKAAVFFKPYPQEKLFECLEWAAPVAEFVGIDIDSYNIVTMRNKARLEKKTAAQLSDLRRAAKVPFAVKGVWTKDDLNMIEELKPDVAYISNHGGRVETDIGSTAEFLLANVARLKKFCGAVWVDGGVRSKQDVCAALALGAQEVLVGRPAISAFIAKTQHISQPQPFWL